MFAGYAAPFCGQLNLTQQAELYHKTVVEITYFVRTLLHLSWHLLTPMKELGGVSWSGKWRIFLLSTLTQIRSKLSHLLGCPRMSCNTGLGAIDDRRASILVILHVAILCWFFWDGGQRSRSKVPR